MKRMIMLIILLAAVSSCGAYRNEAQYAKGDWDFWLGPDEVSRVLEEKLALEKLKKLPAKTKTVNGVSMGYEGVVFNNRLRKFTVIISGGPEEDKEYYIDPDQQIPDYLLPGVYTRRLYFRGKEYGRAKRFKVSAQTKNFLGRNVHWIVIVE